MSPTASRLRFPRIVPLNAVGARRLRRHGDTEPDHRSDDGNDGAGQKRVIVHSPAIRSRTGRRGDAGQRAGLHERCADAASAPDEPHLGVAVEPSSRETDDPLSGPHAAGRLVSWPLPLLVLKQKLNHSLTNCNSLTRAGEEADKNRICPAVPGTVALTLGKEAARELAALLRVSFEACHSRAD